MLSPKAWFYRHLRQLRLALVLCLVVSYGTLLLLSIPILAYFDQLKSLENPSSKQEDTTVFDIEYSRENPNPYRSGDQSEQNTSMPSVLPSTLRIIITSTTHPHSKTTNNNTNNNTIISAGTKLDRNSPNRTILASGPWNLPVLPVLLNTWSYSKLTTCNNNIEFYSQEFSRLRFVLIDRKFCNARAKGGEEISQVLKQDEYAEYYSAMKHCFQSDCGSSDPIKYRFNGNNFLNTWIMYMKTFDVKIDQLTVTETDFTIAFMRREYANLYHTVNDWYNLFLMMVFFRRQPDETNILLIDAHPKGSLDPAWPVLFNSTRMLSALPQRALFTDMVWGMQGYNSVLKRYYNPRITPPLLEEFRQFVLDRFQLNTTRTLNCSNISVLFIWRRDYLAHPRNPSGEVQRKIANENELLTEMKNRHPKHTISGVQIDKFSMRDQLKLVTDADILIGMHGAGLSHTLFVQPHGGTIELVPNYYGQNNDHFVDLAKWRGLATLRWINVDPRNELKGFMTVIPVHVMDGLLVKMVDQICTETQQERLEKRKFENITQAAQVNHVNNRRPVRVLNRERPRPRGVQAPMRFRRH